MARISSNLSKIYWGTLVGNLSFMEGVMIPFYREWAALSYAEIFALQSVFSIALAVFLLPSAFLATKTHRKIPLLLSPLFMIAASVLYGTVNHFNAFVACEAFWGAAFSCNAGALEAVTYDELARIGKADESAKVFSRVYALEGLGLGLGALIGMPLALATAWNIPMLAMIVPCFASFLIFATLREKTRGLNQIPPRPAKPVVNAVRQSAKRPTIRQIFGKFWDIARSDGNFRALAIVLVLFEVVGMYIYWVYPPKLIQVGIPYEWWGILTFFFNAVLLVVSRPAGKLGQIWSARRAVITGVVTMGGLFCLLALTNTPAGAIVLITAILLGDLGFYALFLHYLQGRLTSASRVTAFAMIQLLGAGARAVVGPFIGHLMDLDVNLVIVLLGLLMFALIPVALKLKNSRAQKLQVTPCVSNLHRTGVKRHADPLQGDVPVKIEDGGIPAAVVPLDA